MQVFIVDSKNNVFGARDIEPTLESYYEVIGCRCIDIAVRTVGGKTYDIICDDEALLTDSPIVSAVSSDGQAMLCGTLIFCHSDDEGCEQGLVDSDVRHLVGHVVAIGTPLHPGPYFAMGSCDYPA